jgi:TrmH RNA methyltransferase
MPKIPKSDFRPSRSNGNSAEGRSRRFGQESKTPGSEVEKVVRIAGLPAVEALFKRAPERALRLFYEDRMVPKVGDFCAWLAGLRRPYRLVDADELAKIAGTVLHGGIVAIAEPKIIRAFDLEEALNWAVLGEPLAILDGIGNPHNLGAIARTLAFFGFRRLVISDHPAQASLSDAAYRIAEGGLEFLEVYRVTQLPRTLEQLGRHFRIVGTALGRGKPLEALGNDHRPAALVLGNEEDGLGRATLSMCELVVTVPGVGTVQSLNVSATAAILAYALRPETGQGKRDARIGPAKPKVRANSSVRGGRQDRGRNKAGP